MPTFTRKQLSLSQQNLSSLREWAHRYDLSESELVRRAIDAYDPEQQQTAPISEAQEREEAAALLDHISIALKSALEAVDGANTRVNEALASFGDAGQRRAIALEVEQEVYQNPGFLDEVAILMGGLKENSA